MPSTIALSLSKWALDVATKVVKADVRMHHASVVRDNLSILFVVNHFTRLETLLLPYVLHKHTGREVMGLAAAELFNGRIGRFLQSTGTISTAAPDRDKIIIHSLLKGDHPWMIFPEGSMVKDKKVIDHKGEFAVYHNGLRRPPHKGAAVLALRAEFYRRKIECLYNRPGREGLDAALEKFGLDSPEAVLGRRTAIIPVNITYFPMRAHDNVMLRLAGRMAEDLSKRAIEELSVEGTVLSEDTDIDITLGDPIEMDEYLNMPEYAALMACSTRDLDDLERDPASMFNEAARMLMLRYMQEIYRLTTVNYDHLFAGLLRHLFFNRFDERCLRERAFLCANQLRRLDVRRIHGLLERTHRGLVYEDSFQKFDDFLALCIQEGVVARENGALMRVPRLRTGLEDYQTTRARELTDVIANEIEPLPRLYEHIRRVACLPQVMVSWRVREMLVQEDRRVFEEDYARFFNPKLSKSPDVGRPFLLRPLWVRGGVVLAHGYMAAPLEVRALAEYLYQRGYVVYGVRLKGHGTSPEDLAQSRWEDWYEAVSHGHAIVRTFTDQVFVGGFSTGGCLALIAAARKPRHLRGVFSICAPLKLQNYSVRLAPSLVTLNSLLRRFGRNRESWEYVDNFPENKHINYTRNPLTGVSQLVEVMDAMDACLPDVKIPALVVQGSKDPTVNPASGTLIFDQMGSVRKELAVFERERHGIINGDGATEIFDRVYHFLRRAGAIVSKPDLAESATG